MFESFDLSTCTTPIGPCQAKAACVRRCCTFEFGHIKLLKTGVFLRMKSFLDIACKFNPYILSTAQTCPHMNSPASRFEKLNQYICCSRHQFPKKQRNNQTSKTYVSLMFWWYYRTLAKYDIKINLKALSRSLRGTSCTPLFRKTSQAKVGWSTLNSFEPMGQ